MSETVFFKVGDRFQTPCGMAEVVEQSFGCVRLSGALNFWCGTSDIDQWIKGGSWKQVYQVIR